MVSMIYLWSTEDEFDKKSSIKDDNGSHIDDNLVEFNGVQSSITISYDYSYDYKPGWLSDKNPKSKNNKSE